MPQLQKFIQDQLSVWPLATTNFRSLKTLQVKEMTVLGLKCKVQYNPQRVLSSTADTSSEAIASRPCFLCEENCFPEQSFIRFEGRKGRTYRIQLNPYPIFPGHLVIVRSEHRAQQIWHHLPDMLDFVKTYPEYLVFYNGPESGASAPDHLHFQAIPTHSLPLEEAIDSFLDEPGIALTSVKDATLYRYKSFSEGIFALKGRTSKSLTKLFYQLLDCCETKPEQGEPAFNLFVYTKGDEFRAFVTLRRAKRSHHYYSTGSDHLTISPGAADMAGVFICPMKKDFGKVSSEDLENILSEVSAEAQEVDRIERRLTRSQRKISVGILLAQEISFEILSDGASEQKVRYYNGQIEYNGLLYDELYFDSMTRSTLFAQSSFVLKDVVIGIDFHWQQKRTLSYAGALKFIVEGDKIRAINIVGLEDYLLSVISSEMKATASVELLKAHAVISRSWLMARVLEREHGSASAPHRDFDVCADDHCQRYQGLTMATTQAARTAIDQTWGQLLLHEGELCDARYSKCCGGRTELFSTCWEDKDYPYLQSVEDPFCDCEDSSILSEVLNDYDTETRDFHDWSVSYTHAALSELVRKRTGIDFGEIQSLEPIERGPSGRIKYLRIQGTLRSETIGKELAIRRALSESHLKSSAFEVSYEGDKITLKGWGWGHGVGLCQIGAAAMAAQGYNYRQILLHYYAGTEVK